jgi:hypothetical protein
MTETPDDEMTVIGPECFASADETVICWRGNNYYRAAELPPVPSSAVVASWAVLELMGHRQAIGRISETTIAGRQMIRIDRIDTEPESPQYYGPESVYCLTPVTEEQARLLAKNRYKTHVVPPALTAALDDDDDEDDDGSGPWGFGDDD